MTPAQWPCPLPSGGISHEYAAAIDTGQSARLLIIPALFDEGNRLRRLTLEVMRRLSANGIASFLPDLPGTNESTRPPEAQTTRGWLAASWLGPDPRPECPTRASVRRLRRAGDREAPSNIGVSERDEHDASPQDVELRGFPRHGWQFRAGEIFRQDPL